MGCVQGLIQCVMNSLNAPEGCKIIGLNNWFAFGKNAPVGRLVAGLRDGDESERKGVGAKEKGSVTNENHLSPTPFSGGYWMTPSMTFGGSVTVGLTPM